MQQDLGDLGGRCAENAFAPLSQWTGWLVGRIVQEIPLDTADWMREWGTGGSMSDRWSTSGHWNTSCCCRVGCRGGTCRLNTVIMSNVNSL